MPMRHDVYVYDDELMGFFPVCARADVEAARYADLDPNFTTSSPGAIRASVKIFAPGFFAGTIPGSVKDRLLPRTYAAATLAAGASPLAVKANTAGVFVFGDVISIIAPSARVNIQSISPGWVAGDTITVTINNFSIVYTVVAADINASLSITNTLIADKIAAAIRTNPYFRGKVNGLSAAGAAGSVDIVFWSLDFSSLYSLVASDTGANGTVTAATAVFTPNTTVGTITSVNTTTNVLTITAAAVSVPSGLPIGNPSSSPVGQGLISPSQPIDLLFRDGTNFALYTEAYLYIKRMPYWDGEIAAAFPGLILTS